MRLFSPTIGNDPEIFVKKGIHLVPGESLAKDKKFPRYVKVDNAALEIHPGPFTCLQQQNASIANQIAGVRKVLGEEFRISLRTCERVRPVDIAKYKSLTSFGCEPSLVFHPEMGVIASAPEVDPTKVRERSIGFHVHLGSRTPLAVSRAEKEYQGIYTGYTSSAHLLAKFSTEKMVANILHTTEGRARLVQACDLIVGLPAVLIDRDPRQIWRRKLLGYGKAGEFREQKHGFEYRTLGPWPLTHPILAWWANAMVREALNLVLNDIDLAIKEKVKMLDVANAINTNSLERAIPLWNNIKIFLINNFASDSGSHPGHYYNVKKFEFLAIKGGLKFLVPTRGTQSDNWLKRGNESGSREWSAYYNGFPNGIEALLKGNNNLYKEFKEFEGNYDEKKDMLSKHLL